MAAFSEALRMDDVNVESESCFDDREKVQLNILAPVRDFRGCVESDRHANITA